MPEVIRMRRHVRQAIIIVKSYIDEHPLNFNLNEIEELTQQHQLYVGRHILQKGFKQLYGSSLKNYEKKKRLEAACPMLEEGRLTLAQIADKCGYGSQSSFTRAFKEMFHMTPTEYQNTLV